MKVINICEAGSPNVLKWALDNNADIQQDIPLQSVINDELCYLITLGDVNLFELFRLSQLFRDKMRIINENQKIIPDNDTLKMLFPGDYQEAEGKDPIPRADLAEAAISSFVNLVMQMNADDDIIREDIRVMFFPMICRRFDVQIPIGFVDFMSFLKPEDVKEIFNENYPASLNEYIQKENNAINLMMQLNFIRHTAVLRYNKNYENYLKAVRYAPLNTYKDKTAFKCSLTAFSKYNQFQRCDIRCSMFHPDKDSMMATMAQINNLSTPLECEFAIELPIPTMMNLLSSYTPEELPVLYNSSISDILDRGISYDAFLIPDDEERKNPDMIQRIDAYAMRIAECKNMVLNAIHIMMKDKDMSDIDIRSAFAMLPAIYTTRCVITVNEDHLQKFLQDADPIIYGLFHTISRLMVGVKQNLQDIKDTKQ